MANFHKLTVIGRLVRDPESRTFPSGGKVAKFGIPIDFTRRKKNPETGQWEGQSFIIDVDCFNRDSGFQLADLVMQYLKKGSQVYVEGRLKPNEYTDRNGVKTFKPVLVADNIQFLDSREGAGAGDGSGYSGAPRANASPSRTSSMPSSGGDGYESGDDHGGPGNGGQEDIPF